MLNALSIPLPVLPEELIGEILLRLPVRSLLQFKCVCKSWKTLISGSQFIKSHLGISISDPTMTNQQLVFSDIKRGWIILSYPLKLLFKKPSTPVKPVTFGYMEEMLDHIIGSCNGLLCMLGIYPLSVGLYNPSLRFKSKISLVPVSVLEQDWFIKHCGFGYDKVNDKYKVLLVMERFCHVSPMLTKIYTFGQHDSWKTISNSPYNHTKALGKFVSGTLNWLVSYRNTFVSFDIEKETYRKLWLPQKVGVNTELSVLSDCLCVSDAENLHWVLWMMKEYGVVESWTKFIIIPYDKLLHNHTCLVEPLFISQNGVLMLLMGSKLILYNTNTDVALDLLITTELGFYSQIHCESLVSLSC